MNPVDFCYWLQGFFELNDADNLSPQQVQAIKSHLNLVFLHSINPQRNDETDIDPMILNEVHNGQQTVYR
jgi:hypothetical protein